MRIPIYYLISDKLTPEEVERVSTAISITPLDCAVIQRQVDREYAGMFHPLVLDKDSLPGLLAGDARFGMIGSYPIPLTVVYGDGQKEPLLC